MARFYFKIRAVNRGTYIYSVEAEDEKMARAFMGAYAGVGEVERMDAEDVPPGMTFEPSQIVPQVWEGQTEHG